MRRIWLVGNLQMDDVRNARGIGNNARELPRDNRVNEFFITESDALARCEQLASEHPMTPYAVFSIAHVRETAQPTVISKQFNDQGELLVI